MAEQREQFEKWLRSETCEVHYDNSAEKNAWYGWQAALALAPRQSEQWDCRHIAEQVFFHVLLHGGEGNPFRQIANQWFIDLAAPKLKELIGAPKVQADGGQGPGEVSLGRCFVEEKRTL